MRKVKILAVKQNISVSALLTSILEEAIAHDEGYQTARQNHIRLLQQEIDLGTHGSIEASRDELHTSTA